LWFVTFTGKYRGKVKPHKTPKTMSLPLITLAILVCVFGLFAAPFLSFVDQTHEGTIATIFDGSGGGGEAMADEEHHVPIYIEVLPIVVGVGGISLAALTYLPRYARINPDSVVNRLRPIHTLLYQRYYFDHLYLAIAEKVGFGTAWLLNKVDILVIEGAISGIAASFIGLGRGLRRIQTGLVENYAAIILLGLLLLMLILWLMEVF
jgi:NADH-quinone oxidoreductase subunit L